MEISINQTDDKVVRYIPVQTVDHKVCIHQDTKLILNEFCKRNNEVHDSEKIVRMYQQMCREKVPEYLVKLSGMSRFFQRVMRRLGITKYYTKIKYSKRECNLIIDYLYCISHREAIETGLSVVYNSEDE